MSITLKRGNLLQSDCNIICHQVNCQGVMGAGIAKQIRNKYPEMYSQYHKECASITNLLGKTHLYEVGENKYIANMYAQNEIYPMGVRHTDYDAFVQCCEELRDQVKILMENNPSVHYKIGFPYNIGCGLAGGNWNIILGILCDIFLYKEYDVEIWKL